ncbi:oligopeptide/dipeptide ABC transporter ATP-binding protein [Streptomyces sp. NPDC002133]|uniref:oligopeptide/dipeptide ABC transporter ATP-binding protein n=1 Tax=Streptomyces sp. NPDC002133 TaxID=3154409 RepID=UPI00332542F2
MSLLELDGVKVHFPVRKGILFDRTVGHVYAVDGVSLSVEAGQTYGLVGESGCGKTTLGRAVLRLVDITDGEVVLDGTDLAKLPEKELRSFRRRLQMVFQDPLGSLNPRQNIESILSEGMAAHGIGANQDERREKIKEILAKVGLPSNALSRYPHEFSGGQRQRIGIARALVLEPDVIICDEPVSALDVSIQAQVINLLEELQESMGLTYLVIAHDLAVVRHISDVIGVMYLGSLVEEAPSDALYAEPKHPYTKALMSAVPVPDPEVEDHRERILLVGDLPSPANPPAGCRFHTRCPWKQDTLCATDRPELRDLGSGHKVACHFAAEIASGEITRTSGEVVPAVREGVEDAQVDVPSATSPTRTEGVEDAVREDASEDPATQDASGDADDDALPAEAEATVPAPREEAATDDPEGSEDPDEAADAGESGESDDRDDREGSEDPDEAADAGESGESDDPGESDGSGEVSEAPAKQSS